MLETRHIWFYFILFVLCSKKQDKLHCFYSKSLVLCFPYIYLLKTCHFDRCHPWHPHTHNASEQFPPCKATAGDSQLVLIRAIPNRIFIRQMRSLTALSLLSDEKQRGRGGEDGSWGSRATIKGCVVLSLSLAATIFKGVCLGHF